MGKGEKVKKKCLGLFPLDSRELVPAGGRKLSLIFHQEKKLAYSLQWRDFDGKSPSF